MLKPVAVCFSYDSAEGAFAYIWRKNYISFNVAEHEKSDNYLICLQLDLRNAQKHFKVRLYVAQITILWQNMAGNGWSTAGHFPPSLDEHWQLVKLSETLYT